MSTAEVASEAPVEPEVPLEEPAPATPEPQPSDPAEPVEPSEPAEPEPASPDAPAPDAPSPDEPQEPPADVPGAPSVEAQQQAFDKAFKRAKTYAQGVMDVLGEGSRDLIACPRCQDFLPGFILPHDIKPVTEEQRVAVKLSMGEAFEPVYKQSDQAAQCSNCDGWGKVATGSHVRNQDKVQCPNCDGIGFTGPLAQRAKTLPQQHPATAADENGGDPEPTPDTDPWGRLRGDPAYGILPGYEQ